MRSAKILCLLLCVLILGGCATESPEEKNNWIPEKDVLPAFGGGEQEEEPIHEIEKQIEKYNLKDSIKLDDRLFYSLNELRQIIGDKSAAEDSGLHRNTFFIDNNGLLCIGVDAVFDFEKNQCILKKEYYMMDKSVFTEEESFNMKKKWKKEKNDLYLELSFLAEIFAWEYQIGENGEAIISDKNITLENNSSVVYEPVVFEVMVGKYWSVLGKVMDAGLLGDGYGNRFSCTKPESYVKVMEGERLRFNFYCSWIPEVASVLFLDDDDKVIQFYAYTHSTTLTDCIVTVPKGATKMHLSFFNNQKYQIDRVRYVEGADLEKVDLEWYEEQCNVKLEENQKVSWQNTSNKPLDKGYVTFVLDDCRGDMDSVADLFEEYEIPLCIGAIHDQLYNSTSGGKESRLDVCRRVVQNGGEILAHNAEPLTEELLDDFQTKSEHFYKDKKYLEAYGFKVQGIILAGGEGQVAGSEKSDAWVRTYFNYSDLYGIQEKGEPYYHQRLWLINCKDNYKKIINDAVENKQWVSFFFHEFAEVDKEKVEEILQYVSSMSKEKLEVTNYSTIYEKSYQ